MLLTVGLLFATEALATGFEAKAMRDALPAREVDRSLVMERGWLEFGVGYHHHIGLGSWGPDGSAHKFDNAKWTYGTARVDIRWGIAPHAEIFWVLPFHYARIRNDLLGTKTGNMGLGDLEFGWRHELYRTDGPLTAVMAEVSMKVPSAAESPGTYIGGPNNVSKFIFTTGTPDLRLVAAAKRQLGPVALTLHAGYEYRFAGVVQYLVEVEQSQFAGRIKPGDRVTADLEILAQLGPVAITAAPEFEYRMETKLGTTSPGLFGNRYLEPVEGSDGWSLDARGQVIVQITRGLDIIGYYVQPIRGEDLQFFPLEDIHPTRGPTFGGVVEARY